MTSAVKWKAHTSTTRFATEFENIIDQYAEDNELLTQKTEEFLISEGQIAGVIQSRKDKIQKNPNRWSKHLAPWFD
jgi:hypothetical protein